MFSWLRSVKKAPFKELRVPSPQFLGEQDGPNEREIKDQWVAVLAQTVDVKKAFLVRTIAGSDGSPNVMLCIFPSIADPHALVQKLADLFRAKFDTDTFVDIVFLNSAQEADVSRVAKPFYSAT